MLAYYDGWGVVRMGENLSRDLFEDHGLWRVLQETVPLSWVTLATFATRNEARAFLEGLSFGEGDKQERHGLAVRTYSRAVDEYKAIHKPKRTTTTKADTAALMRRAAIPKGTDDPLLLALGAQRLVCKKHEESEPCSVCARARNNDSNP